MFNTEFESHSFAEISGYQEPMEEPDWEEPIRDTIGGVRLQAKSRVGY